MGLESEKGQKGAHTLTPRPALRPHLESGRASRALFASLTSGALSQRERCGHQKTQEKRGGVGYLYRAQCGLPRLSLRDTYGRAGGSLSSSFSIFASRTLWGESKGSGR